jgi:rSAM/selenodomain-associated transferase 1
MNDDCKIIVFAKAPVAGFAKTRLARVIGDEAAAKLASRMLSETVAQAVAAAVGPVEICCAPDTSHAQFTAEKTRHQLTLTSQGEGDLGERMSRAFDRALVTHQRVIIIGTDAPDLQAPALQQAATALVTHGAVFAPAYDGGYVMVGLSHAMPSLFQGIAWSTSKVMAQTRKKLALLNEHYFELPAFFDVDEASDLRHLPAGWLAA